VSEPTREQLLEALKFYAEAWHFDIDAQLIANAELLADAGAKARMALRGNEPFKPAPEVKRTHSA